MMRRKGNIILKLQTAEAEYADIEHGPVLCLLGAVDESNCTAMVFLDDPKLARDLSTKLFEWSIREELRRKYDGS